MVPSILSGFSLRAIAAFLVAVGASGLPVLISAAEPADDAKPLRVAVLVFPGVELLDFAGPAEIFAGARDPQGNAYFEVYTIGPSTKPLKSMRFLTMTPQHDPTGAPAPDLVVLPGGNVEAVMNQPALLEWIERQHAAGATLFSICNGASVLAKLGYLDGLEVATHHDNVPLLELLAPQAKCRRDCKFVDNGKIVTAAGISSGIDAALYVVSRLKGPEAAKRVASYVEYDHYVGFRDTPQDQPLADASGVVRQSGRVHESSPWAIVRLITILREEGVDQAAAAYPQIVETADGADRDMVTSAGISMSANWLLKHGRDRSIAMDVIRLNVAANPDSPLAHTDLGRVLLESGDKTQARASFERALALDPDNRRARELLDQCR